MIRQSTVITNYRWTILIAVFLIQAVVSLVWYSFGPLAPFLIDAFHITRAQVGLFTSLTSLSTMIFSMPAGWLVDKFGVRRLLLLGAGVFGFFFALFSQVPGAVIGYALIFIAGFAYVFVTPTTTMALVHWFPANERATAISIKQSGPAIGTAVGALIIPALSLLAGWRNAVLVLGVGLVAFAVLGWAIYRERRVIDYGIQTPGLKMVRRVLADRALLHLGVVGAVYFGLQMSAMTYLILQLVEVRGMSEVMAGTFLMATNLGSVAGRILFGFCSDRVFGGQRWQVLTLIGVISGAIAILLAAASNTMSPALLYVAVILFGFTGLGWNGVYMTFASELPGRQSAATGLGWIVTLCTFGSVAGPPFFGYVVDVTSSYSLAWLIFGICVIVSAFTMISFRKRQVFNA